MMVSSITAHVRFLVWFQFLLYLLFFIVALEAKSAASFPLSPTRPTTPSTRLSDRRTSFSAGVIRNISKTPSDEQSEDGLTATSPIISKKKWRDRNNSKKRLSNAERREAWLERYGSLEALQCTFGKGPWWGDLGPARTRRLYHTLLPRTLLGLVTDFQMAQADELAPLAFQARLAAKEYARSRCTLPARMATVLFDQYRMFRQGGAGRGRNSGERSKSKSMYAWDALWAKYEAQIMKEDEESGKPSKEKDLTMRIYVRILERSCVTNQAIDALFLPSVAPTTNATGDQPTKMTKNQRDEQERLEQITRQLETDVRAILLQPRQQAKMMKQEAKADKKRIKIEAAQRHDAEKKLRKEFKMAQKHAKKEAK